MRVIAGKAKRISLAAPPGMDTRPTTDRIKETLFNMLQGSLADCLFLDLFAGSGAIGIEALSRGAKQAVFIEQDRTALACIRENLTRTKLTDQALVYPLEVIEGIHKLEKNGSVFDVIFLDPPYRTGEEERVLRCLAQSVVVGKETLIVVEAAKETSFDFAGELGFILLKQKEYKTNQHVYLKRDER